MADVQPCLIARTILGLDLGAQLSEFRRNKEYADDWGTWTAYLGDPDIALSASYANSCINAYEIFIEKWGFEKDYLAEIPWEKLAKIVGVASLCFTKEEVQNWIEEARSLSKSDLNIRVGEFGESDVKEAKTRTVKVFRHEACGKFQVDMDKEELCTCEGV